MKLPDWIPEVPKPGGFDDDWHAMTHTERQWSFIADMVIMATIIGMILLWATSAG